LIQPVHRKGPQHAGHHHFVAERSLIGRVISREVDIDASQLADRPGIAGVGLGQTEIAQMEPRHVKRIAPTQAAEREAALQQLIQRPGQSGRLPLFDLQFAIRPPRDVAQCNAAVEQSNRNRLDLHIILREAGLETRRGKPFCKRDCRGADSY
jgi:hypothetical protein